MTDPPPKPKRGRWRWWLTAALAGLTIPAGISSFREWQQRRSAFHWMLQAKANGVSCGRTFGLHDLPEFRYRGHIAQLLGKHHMLIAVRDDAAAERLLSLPVCPVPATVSTTNRLTDPIMQELKARYGTSFEHYMQPPPPGW